MKKYSRYLISFLIIILMVTALSGSVSAAAFRNEPYYYEDYAVKVVAQSDRTYEITETIAVWFNEESHGIFRTIPLEAEAEGYRVTDISVDGAPFEVNQVGGELEVRIGDPDVTLSGPKEYVLRYNLRHYADYVSDKDYFYVNVLGGSLDAPVAHFSAEIQLPENGELLNDNIVSGPYGANGNDLNIRMSKIEAARVVKLESTDTIPAYSGVTYWAEFTEGAFPDAKEYVPPYIINQFDATVTADKYSGLVITEKVVFTPQDPEGSLQVRLPAVDDTSFQLKSVTVTMPGGKYDTTDYAVWFDYGGTTANEQLEAEIRIEYTRVMGRDGEDDVIALVFWDTLHESYIEHYNIRYSAPVGQPKGTDLIIGRYNESADQSHRYTIDKELDGCTVTGTGMLSTRERMTLVVTYPDGTFSRRTTLLDYLGAGAGGVLGLISVLLAVFYKKQRPLSPPIEYYPPDGMNPAEVGYVIDRTVDGRDITALIYYWASHGHLKIEMQDKKNFVLHRTSDLDSKHPRYEVDLWNDLWNINRQGMAGIMDRLLKAQPQQVDNNSVASWQLENNFYVAVQQATTAVRSSFTGTRSITNRSADSLSYLLFFACLIALFGIGIFSGGFVAVSIAAIGSFFATSLVRSAVTNKHKKSPVPATIIAFIIGAILIGVLVVSIARSGHMSVITAGIFSITTVVGMLVSPLIARVSDFGAFILEKCIGFKMFLTTAERPQLEAMLEQNPDYYYNILPYAQVLGVTAIWSKKFDGLLTRPPTWYYGAGVDPSVPMTMVMAQQMNSMGSTLNSRPVSASSGSGGSFSGGGGGFSGGGSSGGGSGGGGGGRW